MNGVPLAAYLGVAMFMFTIGVIGVVVRRNPIVIFMCIELMLNAANLTFVAFARYQPFMKGSPNSIPAVSSTMSGQVMVLFVMAVAAAEVAVGLGIIMAIYRLRDSIDVDELTVLRG